MPHRVIMIVADKSLLMSCRTPAMNMLTKLLSEQQAGSHDMPQRFSLFVMGLFHRPQSGTLC